MKVPAFDLRSQSHMLKEEIMIRFGQVLDSSQFVLGTNGEELETEMAPILGVRTALGVANGSDALYLALLALGVGLGDEVITTPFTFFATGGSIARTGATPVFADIDPVSFNLDPVRVRQKITRRTKVIMPVHLYGQMADMDAMVSLAREHSLGIVEDAAQAVSATYNGQPACSMGDIGCLSFYPTKNLGGYGDAGMVATSNPELAERLRKLRVHGASQKYYHELLGINSRLDELQAAVLLVKLRYLEVWTENRRSLAARYTACLETAGLSEVVRPPQELPGRKHVYHQYVVRVKDRDALAEHLKKAGVGSTVYYPHPLHLLPVFDHLGYRPGDLPAAEAAAVETLALPMFPEMSIEQVDYVVDQIRLFYRD